MADFREGLGGAAAGAATGASIGSIIPGVGTAIGGAVGGLLGGIGGLFGGDDDDERERARQALVSENRALLKRLTGEFEAAERRTPTDTLFFSSGVQQLNEAQEQEAQSDAAGAAARGLTGTEFEIAQAGNRSQARADALSGLLTGSEQFLASQRARALGRLLQQRRTVNALQTGNLDRQLERESAANRLLASTVATAVPVLAGLGK